jgi:hypothetical protein
MGQPDGFTIFPGAHPEVQVRWIGLALDHLYVTQMWTAVLGADPVRLLRSLPQLWQLVAPVTLRQEAARVRAAGIEIPLEGSLGDAVDRLIASRFGERRSEPGHLTVYNQVPPLLDYYRQRVPPLAPAFSRAVDDTTDITGRARMLDRLAGTGRDTAAAELAL